MTGGQWHPGSGRALLVGRADVAPTPEGGNGVRLFEGLVPIQRHQWRRISCRGRIDLRTYSIHSRDQGMRSSGFLDLTKSLLFLTTLASPQPSSHKAHCRDDPQLHEPDISVH